MKNILDKIKKIAIVLQIFMLIFPATSVLASSIDVGDELYIERGDLGFYTIQYWNENREMWMYITYSRTYYTDENGDKQIAYCMNPELDGVGWLPGEDEGYKTLVESKLSDYRILNILKNGYPYVSPENLGVETADDAYLATKQAVYWVIRNWKLENVYNHFRAGETEINGQNLEEIQRRGKKVVDAIYKLVNIGYNTSQTIIELPTINEDGEFEQDSDINFYSKKYTISKTGVPATFNITSVEKAPNGTYISDMNGNPKTTFQSGESFKVMVHKEEIKNNYSLEINYERTCESYPIYYVKSKVDGKQNYVILLDKMETEKGMVKLNLDGYLSSLKIIKIDEDTKAPVPGVKFYVRYDNGIDIGNYTTDENGNITIKNIMQGNIVIKEIEAPEGYIKDNNEKRVTIDYKSSAEIQITNTHKKGSLEITKTDKENENLFLQGVEFDLLDEKNNIVNHLVTDENGKAKCNEINTGTYILRETKTNEAYKLVEDRTITIEENKTVELKVENEKKKGKIKILKCDKDNENIRLEGVEFDVKDKDNNKIEHLTTNENGEAETKDIAIGEYKIVETKTREEYVFSEEETMVNIEENQTKEIILTNEKKKGQIKIVKISKDDNNATNEAAGSPIQNVKFNLYDKNNKFIEELITDENGEATSSKLILGEYKVKEIETDKWYILQEDFYNVSINQNKEIVTVKIENSSKNPKIDIEKECKNSVKPNEEIKYEFNIKNTGNTELENFTWYDILSTEVTRITKISTGTFNQDLTYGIYYKTNLKNIYMILKQDLSSKTNNYIDLTQIHLDEGEKITEIKVDFGNVQEGFSNVENPEIYLKVNEDLKDGVKINNYTIIEGKLYDYKVTDEDNAEAIVYNVVEKKKLPRTGF